MRSIILGGLLATNSRHIRVDSDPVVNQINIMDVFYLALLARSHR